MCWFVAMDHIIKQHNLEYELMKVIACTFYMHISLQHSVCAQQEQFWKFLIAPPIVLFHFIKFKGSSLLLGHEGGACMIMIHSIWHFYIGKSNT